MKSRIYILTLCLLAIIPACIQQEELPADVILDETPVLSDFTIRTSLSAMQVGGGKSSSRSLEPMGPEEENPVKSLAVIQFDSEGNLLRINRNGSGISSYYHFRDFTDGGELPGELSPTLTDISLFSGLSQTRVCFIGNMEEEEVEECLYRDGTTTPVGWTDFQNKTVTVNYITSGDNVGHVERIYLFGYHEGALSGSGNLDDGTTAGQMSVILSRLIARLEISINLAEDVTLPAGYNIYFRLQNVEEEAYLFLDVDRTNYVHRHSELMPTTNRTDYITGTDFSTFYFYVAPHLVMSDEVETEATRLLIWCTTDDAANLDEEQADAKILLCNDPLKETPTAAGAYWLNRNSIYHVNITLTYEDDVESQSRQTGAPWGVKQADGSYHYTVNMKKN